MYERAGHARLFWGARDCLSGVETVLLVISTHKACRLDWCGYLSKLPRPHVIIKQHVFPDCTAPGVVCGGTRSAGHHELCAQPSRRHISRDEIEHRTLTKGVGSYANLS